MASFVHGVEKFSEAKINSSLEATSPIFGLTSDRLGPQGQASWFWSEVAL